MSVIYRDVFVGGVPAGMTVASFEAMIQYWEQHSPTLVKQLNEHYLNGGTIEAGATTTFDGQKITVKYGDYIAKCANAGPSIPAKFLSAGTGQAKLQTPS